MTEFPVMWAPPNDTYHTTCEAAGGLAHDPPYPSRGNGRQSPEAEAARDAEYERRRALSITTCRSCGTPAAILNGWLWRCPHCPPQLTNGD